MADNVDIAHSADPSVLDRLPMRDENGEIRHDFVEEIARAIQAADKPFLPDRPPVELGGNRPPDPQGPARDGPWSHKN